MLVMILQNVPPGLRGELTRWLIEPKSGTFVGKVPAMVRDKLWEKALKSMREGGVIQIWSDSTEQGFSMRMAGSTDRDLLDSEGIALIRTPK